MLKSSSELNALGGVYSALFTPYDRDGRVNVAMIERLVEFHLDAGLAGFYLTGSTGECFLLSEDERKLVVESVIRFNRGRGKVIVHVGHISTDVAVELATHAEKHGADATSALGPIYFGTTFEGAYRHFSHIAGATGLPFFIYSIHRELDPESDRRFFDIPNVVGMKYTGSDYFLMQQLMRLIDKPHIFFNGCDQLFLGALHFGVSGAIGTTQNIAPAHFVRIQQLFREGRTDEARRVQEEVNRVIFLMLSETDRSYMKAVMRYIGYDCGSCRLPNKQLTGQDYADFAAKLDELGVLQRAG